MGQATKILDELARKERRQNRWTLVIIALALTGIIIVGFLFSIGETTQAVGVATGLSGTAGDHGDNVYVQVLLDDGEKLQILLPPKVPFLKGSRVMVTVRTTKLFGLKRYSFLQYVLSEGGEKQKTEE